MSRHHRRGAPSPRRACWWSWPASPCTWCSRAWPRYQLLPQADLARPGLVLDRRGPPSGAFHLHHRAATDRPAHGRLVLGHHVATLGQCHQPIVPGGAAFGAATQFRMLAAAGNDPATAVAGLTAFSLLGIGGLLALPIFVARHHRRHARRGRTSARGAVGHRGLRALRRVRRTCADVGPTAPVGGQRRAVHAQQAEAQGRAHDRSAGPPGLRARSHPRRAGPALEGGDAPEQRPAGLRLRHIVGHHPGHRRQANPSLVLWPTRSRACWR